MRSILLSSFALLAVTAFDFLPQTLGENDLNLEYSPDLACGACVRSGYSYCALKKGDWYKRASGDICCNDDKCLISALAKKGDQEMECATTRDDFNETDIYYKDNFALLQKFCARRQNATACCGRKNPKDKCELKLKYKEWDNVTIDLQSVAFGGTCNYKIEAKCGYPNLVVNNSNIDMVVTYKKKEWDDDKDHDDDDRRNETFDDDETHEGKRKDGKTEWKLPKKEKKDQDDKKDECQKTKLYLTLTNLNNPTKQLAESRMLQADGDDSIAMMSYASDVADDAGLFKSVTLFLTATLALIVFAF